jgi:hypothetical protein
MQQDSGARASLEPAGDPDTRRQCPETQSPSSGQEKAAQAGDLGLAGYIHRIRGIAYSPKAVAEQTAVYRPFCLTGFYGKKRVGHIEDLISLRRERLAGMADAGWSVLEGRRIDYAEDCPPCGVLLAAKQPRKCTLRVCPFCYGRKIGALYERVQALVKARGAHNVEVFGWFHYLGFNHKDLVVFWDLDRDDSRAFRHALLPLCDRVRDQFQNAVCGEGVGGAFMVNVDPQVFLYDHPEGASGAWCLRMSGLVVAPVGWEFPKTLGRPQQWRKKTYRRLALLVGNTFPYPRGWLRQDPFLVSTTMDWMADLRTLNYFGPLGPTAKHFSEKRHDNHRTATQRGERLAADFG